MVSMGYSITPEREAEVIDRVANLIVSIEPSLGKAIVQAMMPYGEVIGWTGFLDPAITPTLTAVFGDTGFDFMFMMGLDYRKYGPLILDRIKELEEEREQARAAALKQGGVTRTRFEWWIYNLKRKIRARTKKGIE